ncbi:MAG: ATP-binding cassette domain-containing protein [Anaerolineaceae bacterium]|nr:ATP-binding cassette domain-containing protein [Anaerolineaceae bacterium]
MAALEIAHVTKSFGAMRAVDDVSFQVEKGEIFGLLGPNGAGKTTTIRIILDIFKADSGTVAILGGPIDEEKKNRIGYMPEERGLYQDIPLERCLTYLVTLKGLPTAEARRRVVAYLERFDLASYRQKKLKELSKGMQQKAQLIVTLAHQPDLVIIDEPFSALDPVNTQMVKDLLIEQRSQGVTLVMCTHQMHQVEEMCDRLVLIDHGKAVLYGGLEEIRHQFAAKDLLVRATSQLPAIIPGVERISTHNSATRLSLTAGATPQGVLRSLVEQGVGLESFEIAVPTLDEIFIKVVSTNEHGEGQAV